jgi:hypothetical protein
MNSNKFVSHIKEGKYIATAADVNSKGNLMKEKIWTTLQSAIDEWGKLV